MQRRAGEEKIGVSDLRGGEWRSGDEKEMLVVFRLSRSIIFGVGLLVIFVRRCRRGALLRRPHHIEENTFIPTPKPKNSKRTVISPHNPIAFSFFKLPPSSDSPSESCLSALSSSTHFSSTSATSYIFGFSPRRRAPRLPLPVIKYSASVTPGERDRGWEK